MPGPNLVIPLPDVEEGKRCIDVRSALRREFADCFCERELDVSECEGVRTSNFSIVLRTKKSEIAKILKLDTTRITAENLRKMRTELSCMRLDNSKTHLNFMHGFTFCGKNLVIFSEECEYGNLKALTANTQPPLPAFYWIILKVFEALKFLHKLSFVHLDVKGDQFLVTSEGTILLTDFAEAGTIMDSVNKPCVTNMYSRQAMFGPEADTAGAAIVLCGIACQEHPWALDDGKFSNIIFDTTNDVPEALKDRIPEIYPQMNAGLLDLLINMLVIDPKPRPSAENLVSYMERTWSSTERSEFQAAALLMFKKKFAMLQTEAADTSAKS